MRLVLASTRLESRIRRIPRNFVTRVRRNHPRHPPGTLVSGTRTRRRQRLRGRSRWRTDFQKTEPHLKGVLRRLWCCHRFRSTLLRGSVRGEESWTRARGSRRRRRKRRFGSAVRRLRRRRLRRTGRERARASSTRRRWVRRPYQPSRIARHRWPGVPPSRRTRRGGRPSGEGHAPKTTDAPKTNFRVQQFRIDRGVRVKSRKARVTNRGTYPRHGK
mmetsp:Transcript_3565/g.13156  ORF Transcript_3565/g.13156 Transcript_3565/m.13156 type:complete len:217 (+) Transcript_3565:446-1096(+)